MSNVSTPRSRSRSKRSTTNLHDLRLAPLSNKFEVERGAQTSKSPYDESVDSAFARQHSSYLQGKSAPTTPGILSRSSSRKQLGAGLSRKTSIYDDDIDEEEVSYEYAAPTRTSGGNRTAFGSGQIPKAKSDAAILAQQKQHRLAGRGAPIPKQHNRQIGRTRSGAATPRSEYDLRDESWLMHTGATTSALIQEDKGLSWLSSRDSSTSMVPQESDEDEDDEQYEEMAALSASTAKLNLAAFEGGSPASTRVSKWGSRYGSRSVSRPGSRIPSPVGTRTPRRGDNVVLLDDHISERPAEDPGFWCPQDRNTDYEDDKEVALLGHSNSFGLGSFVDRIMGINTLQTEQGQEITDDESAPKRENETAEQAKERRSLELRRRKEEKDRLVSQPPPAPLAQGGDGQGSVGGWTDAAWLLSVASKALF